MSIPYKSNALPEMVASAEEMLHREQKTLWRMKNLLTNLRGDSSWVPAGAVQNKYDEWLLNTILNGSEEEQPDVMALIWGPIANGSRASTDLPKTLPEPAGDLAEGIVHERQDTVGDATKQAGAMTNGETAEAGVPNGIAAKPSSNTSTIEGLEAAATAVTATANGIIENGGKGPEAVDGETRPSGTNVMEEDNPGVEEADEVESQPPSHRMTTRARAHRTSRSPSSEPSFSVRLIHPFFEFNPSAVPGFDAGLPTNEAHDARAFLVSYVSKQEEIVRGLSQLYNGLLQALQMRRTVFKWCKAEGHVGEMSDGEDWYDREEWGLTEDLVKGKEEEDEEVANQKKTRRRGADR